VAEFAILALVVPTLLVELVILRLLHFIVSVKGV